MKFISAFALFLLLTVVSGSAIAQGSQKRQTIEQVAAAFSSAYAGRTMSSLDAGRKGMGSVRVTIEHSLGEAGDKDKYVIKSFSSMGRADKWLISRESEPGFPSRNNPAVKRCRKGVCTFREAGMLHNNLYLKSVKYSYKSGRPFITAVYLIDGD